MTDTLYMFGLVVADIGQETEMECQTRIIAALTLLKGVHASERVPHMVALDNVGEVTVNVFIEQGADLTELAARIEKIPGVTYKDLSEDLVRGAVAQAVIPCGQSGHQCVCAPKTPKPI